MIQESQGLRPKTHEDLARILGGAIARGALPVAARLPPERELAAEHHTSRVTVREALAKLVQWGLLQVRQGSGAVVRGRGSWSFSALPLSMLATSESSQLERMIRDLLSMRRSLVEHGTRRAAGRLARGDLDAARALVEGADASRSHERDFVSADLEMIRSVLVAAELWPVLWLLNDLARSYLELVSSAWPAPDVPGDYVDAHLAYFDAIEAGEADRAVAIMGDYLQRLDQSLCASLGIAWEAP